MDIEKTVHGISIDDKSWKQEGRYSDGSLAWEIYYMDEGKWGTCRWWRNVGELAYEEYYEQGIQEGEMIKYEY